MGFQQSSYAVGRVLGPPLAGSVFDRIGVWSPMVLGGAITAIGLSGANVTLGFLAGFLGLRYLQHAKLPMKAIGGLAFAAIALCITAMARSYDFFMYYFTLVVTPMAMLCGVFYPVTQLPVALQWLATLLPLTHATALVRPLMLGESPTNTAIHILVLVGYAFAGLYFATLLFRQRFLT